MIIFYAQWSFHSKFNNTSTVLELIDQYHLPSRNTIVESMNVIIHDIIIYFMFYFTQMWISGFSTVP